MSDLRITLTPPETLARFEAVAQALLEREGRQSDDLRGYLDRMAAALGVHHLDAARTLEELQRALGVAASADHVPVTVPPDVRIAHNRKDGAEMVWVPTGAFIMGSMDQYPDEEPPHRVQITTGFWLYRTPVTNAQWRHYYESGPAHVARLFGGDPRHRPAFWDEERFQAPEQPVVGVSWEEASAYCRWAMALLPTEAQWEYAARGPDGRTYPWGDQNPEPSRAVFGQDSKTGRPGPVGRLAGGASWCGALDLVGNVWEWCADWYDADYYWDKQEWINPKGPQRGGVDPPRPALSMPSYQHLPNPPDPRRVVRGGSWCDRCLTASNRDRREPDSQANDLGFRPIGIPAAPPPVKPPKPVYP